MSALTVEDVFVRCLPVNSGASISHEHIVQAAKVWLTQRKVLPHPTTADDFFRQTDTFGWAAVPDFLPYWLSSVAAKFLKFAASEYAFFHLPPDADTMWLTSMTAQLVKLEHLKHTFQQLLQNLSSTNTSLPWRWGAEVDTVSILHALLFVLIYYTRPAVAVRVLEPVFLSIVHEQDEIFNVVPQLLSYFIPHMSFQSILFPDRIAMLGEQLVQRGFQFSAELTFSSPNSTPRVVGMAPMKVEEVLRRVRDVSTTTEVRIRCHIEHDTGDVDEEEGLSLNKYLSVVVRVCRQYYLRCKQASKKQLKNGEMLLKLLPNDVMKTMKEMHRMLRLCPPYSERFQKLGIWSDILRSEGWVPLQVIDEQLSLLPNSILKDLPSQEKMEIVESLLRQHDNFQRYQVAFCNIKSSAFHGQRCARSVYGHALRNPPLYRFVICRPECLLRPTDANAMASLPLYGWVALAERPQRSLRAHPSLMPLYDNIPFCVVMPAEAIGAFRLYDETTPTLKRYDEKLRAPQVYFAEVYLRAIARDGEALVLSEDHSSSADMTSSSTAASRVRDNASVVSELDSVASSRASRATAAGATTTGPSTTTEVYSRVQDEADAKTQRWYVFPQYYAKKAPEDVRPAPALPSSSPPASGEEAARGGGATLAQQPPHYSTAAAEVRRRATKTNCNIGLPKLFFTGRLAELRELRSSEASRHAEAGLGSEVSGAGARQPPPQQLSETETDEETQSKSGEKETEMLYRGTSREFDALPDTSEAGTSPTADGAVLPPTFLCEYVIATSQAAPQVLPPVVVRVRPSESEVVVCLSRCEPDAALYQRCFPPSRVQAIFHDYAADPFLKEEEIEELDDEAFAGAEAAAAAEWQQATGRGGRPLWGLRVGKWGISPSYAQPNRPATNTAAAAAKPSNVDSTRELFDLAPLRSALEAFIASSQVVCVLHIRVATEAGEALGGCRQGIDELKHFAKEKALTYSKMGKMSSRERLEQQQQQEQQHGRDGGETDTLISASRCSGSSPSPLQQQLQQQQHATPIRGQGHQVMNWEVMEFRKHVTWSVRQLDHTLHELQLTRGEVPYATLTTALTRECEDGRDNYELLEFIGDAVMDFLVIADACLLSNAAYKVNVLAGGGRGVVSWEGAEGQRPATTATPTPPPVGGKWTPEASAVRLPRTCSVESSGGSSSLAAVMRDTVTAVLCRNRVIAELLPPTVAHHFSEANYPSLCVKVRADVFEAMIGAAYRSGVGLDRLRLLLRRLFSFLPAAIRTTAGSGSVCHTELIAALQMCPYLPEDAALRVDEILHYRTQELFELTPALLEADSGGALGEREEGVNTHLVASRLPRIQAKDYATMFTTGRAYAYRRLFAYDTVRVHNRVLHLFSLGSIGFLNEIFTDTIHLVLDIDKVSLVSWGLLPIMWAWYRSRYRCPAGMFALDCSGQTWVNKERKWKDSCHVHFPQVTVSVQTWDALVTDIRGAVVAALEEKQTRLSQRLCEHAHEYRVWLCRSALQRGLAAVGGEPRPHLWSYCDAAALLQLAQTSRGVRQSVLEHVAYVTHTLDGMARFAELADARDIFVGDAKEGDSGAELVVVEHRPTQQRLVLPLQWLSACRSNPQSRVYLPPATWDAVIDQGLTESRKLRLYLNDKCDTIYGVENRPLVLDTLLLADAGEGGGEKAAVGAASQPPHPPYTAEEGSCSTPLSLSLSSSFVHYRPRRAIRKGREEVDVFATHRDRQGTARREHLLSLRRLRSEAVAVLAAAAAPERQGGAVAICSATATVCAADADATAIAPLTWDTNEFGDAFTQGWVVECAHRSTLTLSSLRTAEYRGTDAQLYGSWVDCAPATSLSEGHQSNDAVPLLSSAAQDDRLPSFSDVFEHRAHLPGQLEDFEWVTWFNFFKMRTPGFVVRDDKTPTIRVWSPAWWSHDPQQHTATFYIATEPVLRLRNVNSLAEALAPPGHNGGGGGLERVAQLLMPHISTKNKMPIKVKEPLVYVLFAEKPGAAPAAANTISNNASPLTLWPSSFAASPSPAKSSPSPQAQAAPKPAAPGCCAASTPAAAETPSSPRVTFGSRPTVVSLDPWLPTAPQATTSPTSEVAWLRAAVSFVFTATAARTDVGSTPLILCETEAIFNDVCAAVRQSATGPQSTWLPCVLLLRDTATMVAFVKEAAAATSRAVLRHIFVVSSAPNESAAKTPIAARSALATQIQIFCSIVSAAVRDTSSSSSSSVRRWIYVRSNAVRDDVQSAVGLSARVI